MITEKFDYHMPLYRLETKFNREGVDISRQTMSDWMAGSALAWATIGGHAFKYILYNFTINRCKEGPLEFFKDYGGYFMSDAYPGYAKIGKTVTKDEMTTYIITHLACFAHARRYFVDAQKTAPRVASEIEDNQPMHIPRCLLELVD